MPTNATININVGVLGHVDSGKTSLCKALSVVASTASFDKSPQSTERGITLDLGFSSVVVDVSGGDASVAPDTVERYVKRGVAKAQLTFVDCPGHASLIRTVVGGAGIVDLMILVLDASKGVQTQTAECMVVGEVLGRPLLVVLNKCDEVLFRYNDKGEREVAEGGRAQLDKLKKRLTKMFNTQTRWFNVDMVEVSASPAGPPPPVGAATPSARLPPENTIGVVSGLLRLARPDELVSRQQSVHQAFEEGGAEAEAAVGRFFMYVDHCFSVRGQGTVLTGTVASGGMLVGGDIALPDFQVAKKVKSMQMFRKAVQRCAAGDRCGVCIGAGFDPATLDRGVACSATAVGSASVLPFYYTNVNTAAGGHAAPRPVADGPGGMQMRQLLSSAYDGFGRHLTPMAAEPPQLVSLRALSHSLASVVVSCNSFVAAIRKVRFHPLPLLSVGGPRMHITVGHTTAMGTLRYFSCPNPYFSAPSAPFLRDASAVDAAAVVAVLQNCGAAAAGIAGNIPIGFDAEDQLLQDDEEEMDMPTGGLHPGEPKPRPPRRKLWFAVVNLDSPITLFSDASYAHTTFLASRLDFDADTSVCRMAVEGHVIAPLQDARLQPFEATTHNAPSPPTQPPARDVDDQTSREGQDIPQSTAPPAPTAGVQFVKNSVAGVTVKPREVTRELKKKVTGSGSAGNVVHSAVDLSPPTADDTGVGPYPQGVPWLAPASSVWASPETACLVSGLLRHMVFIGFYPHPQRTPNRIFHWRSLPALRHRVKVLAVASIVDDFSCVASLPPKSNSVAGAKPAYGDPAEYVGLNVFCDLAVFKKVGGKKEAPSVAAAHPSAVHRSLGSVVATFGSEQRDVKIVFKEPVFQKRGLGVVSAAATPTTERLAIPTAMSLPMVKRVYAPYGSVRILQLNSTAK